jgi:hypothetical protein
MQNLRRSDFDVTNTVQVSSTAAVARAVGQLYEAGWPEGDFAPVERAFEDFDRFFSGQMPGFHGIDTVYHDRQHTLDITLAFARLCAGYERKASPDERLGADRVAVGIVVALFHDSGYLRRKGEDQLEHGAEYTRTHVSRGARLLEEYLPRIGFADWAPMARELIHFTGYEVPIERIAVHGELDRMLGTLLGTADMIAQMADRCYLEKCRDRLYAEFVLGDVAVHVGGDGVKVLYGSGLDLLRQTPKFIASTIENRLGKSFGHAYRHLEPLYGGDNPYLNAIQQNVHFLERLARGSRWPLLRRNPPVFTVETNAMDSVRALLVRHLEQVYGVPKAAVSGA